MRRNIACAALAFLMVSLPASAYASLLISEVSYDPPGTDSKREWIEVEHAGAAPISIASVRFVESGVAHKITAFGAASLVLSPGDFVVIADDPATFLLDYPTFSGVLFDSAFSLTNTGEPLVLTVDGVEVDSIAYANAEGAVGTGASLTRGTAGFMPARPSPGSRNDSVRWDGDKQDEDVSGSSSGNSGSSLTSTHAAPISVSTYAPKADFQAHAGRDRLVSINTPLEIVASAKGAPEGFGARWSFGDGTVARGGSVTKIYKTKGTFVVVLNAIARGTQEKSVDRFVVEAFVPILDVEVGGDGYTVTNQSGNEINLGGFAYQENGGKERKWLQDTIVLDGSSIHVLREVGDSCGLKISYPNEVELLPINCRSGVQSPHDGYP